MYWIGTAAVAVMSALLGAGLQHMWAIRRERHREHRQGQRLAATEFANAMVDLRTVVRHSGDSPVDPDTLVSRLAAFQLAWDRYGASLPEDWRHLRRSINAALGEHFGYIGSANLYPSAAAHPTGALDMKWWENADAYLDYAILHIQRWGACAGGRAPRRPRTFDGWLNKRRDQQESAPFGPWRNWRSEPLAWR